MLRSTPGEAPGAVEEVEPYSSSSCGSNEPRSSKCIRMSCQSFFLAKGSELEKKMEMRLTCVPPSGLALANDI